MYPPPSIGVPLALPTQPVLPPLPALPPIPTLPVISPSSLLSSNPITASSPSEIINTLSSCTTDLNTLLSTLFPSLNPTGQIQQIQQILAVACTQLNQIRDSLDHIFVYRNNRSKAKNLTSGDRKEWAKVATEVLALVGHNDVTARLNCKVINKLCSRFGCSSLVELPLGQAKSYLGSGLLREQASRGWGRAVLGKGSCMCGWVVEEEGKGQRRGNHGWGAEIFKEAERQTSYLGAISSDPAQEELGFVQLDSFLCLPVKGPTSGDHDGDRGGGNVADRKKPHQEESKLSREEEESGE